MRYSEPIKKRRLGQTDIEVTPIGLGVMQFAGGAGVFGLMFPEISQEKMNGIIKKALDGGINWFDTAEMYGRGRSERGLAKGLRAAEKKDAEIIVATKWFPLFRTAGNIPRTILDRLQFLDGYSIDLYIVHQPWGFSPPEVEMNAMADLVEAGKIRSIGVSNFSAEQMRRAHKALLKRGLPLASNQVQYSLLHRKIETNGVIDAAKDLGVTITAWSPLASGVLTGKFHKDPEILNSTLFGRRMRMQRDIERSRPLIQALDEMANRYGTTTAQVALNWLIHFQGETVVAIPGASKEKHAEESAGSMRFRLSDADMARLEELSRAFTSQ